MSFLSFDDVIGMFWGWSDWFGSSCVVNKQVSVASCCFTFLFMLFKSFSGCLNCSNCFPTVLLFFSNFSCGSYKIQNVIKCKLVFKIVLECFGMLHSVLNCFRSFSIVLGCILYLILNLF